MGDGVSAAGYAGSGRPLAMAHQSALQLPLPHTRAQTQAEACEWAMACAHVGDLGERRPAGDIAGELGAADTFSAYTHDQLHSLYARSSRAQGPPKMKGALEATEKTEAHNSALQLHPT